MIRLAPRCHPVVKRLEQTDERSLTFRSDGIANKMNSGGHQDGPPLFLSPIPSPAAR